MVTQKVMEKYRNYVVANTETFRFELTTKDLFDICQKQTAQCYLSGVKLDFENPKDKHFAELDLIRVKRGYYKNNIRFISRTIAAMRGDFDNETFVIYCSELVSHQQKMAILGLESYSF